MYVTLARYRPDPTWSPASVAPTKSTVMTSRYGGSILVIRRRKYGHNGIGPLPARWLRMNGSPSTNPLTTKNSNTPVVPLAATVRNQSRWPGDDPDPKGACTTARPAARLDATTACDNSTRPIARNRHPSISGIHRPPLERLDRRDNRAGTHPPSWSIAPGTKDEV